VLYSQSLRSRPLKRRYMLAENKLLRLKHPPQRFQQLGLQRLVLAFQVQHRNRRSCGPAAFYLNAFRKVSLLHAAFFLT
jgi:hypothetical protein